MSDKLSFQNVLSHLRDSQKDIPQSHLRLYSDLDPQALNAFMETWHTVKPERKLRLLDALIAHFEDDTIVAYDAIGRALLTDPDGAVRARALRLLAEEDDPRLADAFIGILLSDAEIAPRIEAAHLLGEFILLGELDKINPAAQQKIEAALVTVIRSDADAALRKDALEALGYSSHEELTALIESAFERADPGWVASALRAMGRSHDDERWHDDVTGKLLDADPRIRLAAVEAAGELQLPDAGLILMQLLDDEEEDDEVAAAAIWALSQIGGEDVRAYLVNLLDNTDDEAVAGYLEGALENLDFNEELGHFDILDVDEDDEDAP